VSEPSSRDLHPERGARFVFVRTSAEPLRYRLEVHGADGGSHAGLLEWDHAGSVKLDVEPPLPAAAAEEAAKLARVLRRTAQGRLHRWRG